MVDVVLLVTLLAVGQSEPEVPAGGPGPDETEMAAMLHPFFVDQAAAYRFSVGSGAQKELSLVPDPVMTWKGDGSWFGDVFVWTVKGRPEVIGCVGSWNVANERRGVFHEFHSLSLERLSAVRIGPQYTWSPDGPGVTLQLVPNAAVPAQTKQLRAVQLRAMARDFSASMKSEMGMQVLRMQAPLYSYTSESGEEGAIFPFVWGIATDPEVLLVVQTRRTSDGVKWFYAPARFTWREVWVQHKGKEVWHAQQYDEQERTRQLTEVYASIRTEDVSLTELRKYADREGPSKDAAK